MRPLASLSLSCSDGGDFTHNASYLNLQKDLLKIVVAYCNFEYQYNT